MYLIHPLYVEDVRNIAASKISWEKLKNKTVLITGASGMIGTFLIDVLMLKNKKSQLNTKIIAVGRNSDILASRFAAYMTDKNLQILAHDVNVDLPNIGQIDYIIHAASNTHPNMYATDPIGTIMTNLIGTQNLLEYARHYEHCRFMCLSSVEIYGEALADTDIFDESYLGYINCNSLRAGYPEGKRASEALCNAYHGKYNVDFVVARLARIYGPTMRLEDSKALSQFLKKGLAKEDIILKSEGKQLYSYCYVADAVFGLLVALLEGKTGEAYNIADVETKLMLKDIATCIAKAVGQSVVFELPDATEAVGFSKVVTGVMNSKKLQALGWKPIDSIETGIAKTLKIMQDTINI